MVTTKDQYYLNTWNDNAWLLILFAYRWDLEGIDQLPEYMKLYYLALYNTTNETAYIILKEKGFNATHYLKKLVQIFFSFIYDREGFLCF